MSQKFIGHKKTTLTRAPMGSRAFMLKLEQSWTNKDNLVTLIHILALLVFSALQKLNEFWVRSFSSLFKSSLTSHCIFSLSTTLWI